MLRNNLAKLFLFLGSLSPVFFFFLLWQRSSPRNLSFKIDNLPPKSHLEKAVSPPKIIEIKSLNLRLPLLPAKIKDGKWETTTLGVSYLIDAPLPGETGNSILYGHNYPNLLRKLNQVKIKDTIYIIYANGQKKAFIVKLITTVTPLQIQVLKNTKDKRITLYTCTGFLDSKRLVVVAISRVSL